MVFTLNRTVTALVPEAILSRVQNGVDTAFSEAVNAGLLEEKSAWKGKLTRATETKGEAITVNRTLKSKWVLSGDAPGRFILLSVYLDKLEADCGPLGVASLPDFAVAWFSRLAHEVARSAAEAAAWAKAKAEAEAKAANTPIKISK